MPIVGHLSLLTREAFKHASPNAVFTLEATTAKSRDRYIHLGYEVSVKNHCRHASAYMFGPAIARSHCQNGTREGE